VAMKFSRRRFLHLAAGSAALPAVSRIAWAQTYPSRPVRIIVTVPPGAGSDFTARLIGQWLSERLGQQFIIENRPGGGGNIGTEAVVRAPPNGYTLLMIGSGNIINTTLYEKLKFNFIRDIAPVASLVHLPLIMEVNLSVPVKTVPEFIAYAKANPGKLNMASAGNGGFSHIAGELFKIMTDIDMAHIPYQGGAPALTDLLGGRVQVMFSAITDSIEYVRAGRLRALAVTSASRLEILPGIPPVGEFIPGFEASSFYGIGAPKNTSPEIIDKLNREINAALADPKIRTRLADMGTTILSGSSSDLGKLIVEETEKWAKVIRAANIKVE
jgi:tripartite-type tricarboxylate transporter receptor subunit TctC